LCIWLITNLPIVGELFVIPRYPEKTWMALLMRAAGGTKSYLCFAGLLTYSVIASQGCFAKQGQWQPVGMFAVLLIPLVTS
jgi:hypothetical protein